MEMERERESAGNAPADDSRAQQKGVEALADQRMRELAEERRQRDEFVSLVGHELRGPLATLIGYAQMLGRADVPAALRDKATQSVLSQARRLNQMVENLLQASRLTSGRFRMERQPTDLAPLVRQAAAQQQDLAPHHHLVVQVPEVAIVGDWDSNLLALALANLISNAVKFSPSGGQVQIVVRRADAKATVAVSDPGIGIAPEDLPAIFEPYRRPARTERYPGMGVGLYVTKGIVEAHSGEIAVRSKPGQGATFRITLPLSG